MRKIAFLWSVLALTKRPFWMEKNAPVEHRCSHYTESWTYHHIRSNESWRITKRVRRKEKLKKKPVKRQLWCIYTHLCSWLWEQGMNMLLSCGLLMYLYTWHRVFSMKKKVLVVSALYRSRAVDQYRWVRFAGGCLVFLLALFRCLFRVADCCAVFFSSDPAVRSYLRWRRKGKSLIR